MHFSAEEWVDFARKIRGSGRSGAMQQHLEEGCDVCTRNFATWMRLVEFAKQEGNYAPPDFAVRQVTGNFGLSRKASSELRKVEMASLVFDSSSVAVVGVRSATATGRQLLYRSGSMCVDLQLLPKPGTQSVVLIGQLLDLLRPKKGIPVSLMKLGNSVSNKKTNDHGEFDFGFKDSASMHLSFDLEGGRTLVVPVPGAAMNPSLANAH